jgi:hypothetical protein
MHKDKFQCDPEGFQPAGRTKAALQEMNRKVTGWCRELWKSTGDVKDVEAYFEYVLENWTELRANVFTNYTGAVPNLAFISHHRVFRQIRGCMVAGIPDKVAPKKKADNMQDRAANTDWEKEPTVGW